MIGIRTNPIFVLSTAMILSGANQAAPIAFDMVGSASQNLTAYTNPLDGAFSSAGDAFGKLQRGSSPTIPFSLLDDTVSVFPPDTQGIIGETDTDVFFGVTDTINGDNAEPAEATWSFDVFGYRDLELSIDMAAMGDFENDDNFSWSYSIDGGPSQVLFSSTVDEAASQLYTLDSGTEVTLGDPMSVNGTLLNNQLQTLSAALAGTGSSLDVTLTATANGGAEAIAFRNLVIDGAPRDDIVAFDMVGSASQNLISYTNPLDGAFSSAGDAFGKLQRGSSPTIPFSLLDDTVSVFPPDTQGIIGETDTDVFFGVTDTINGDNAGLATATWAFDIAGFEDLSLAILMGAMGDFEASDFFTWTYSIDGGPIMTAFSSIVDESGSQTYTLASGTGVTLDDPMVVDGIMLSNVLQELVTEIVGTGDILYLTLTASANGGAEAFAFRDITIRGARIGNPGDPTDPTVPTPPVLWLFGIGFLGLWLRKSRALYS